MFIYLFLLLLLPPIILLFITTAKPQSSPPLPLGPKPRPIIGNLLQLSKKPHISIATFSKLHGPLISLRQGYRSSGHRLGAEGGGDCEIHRKQSSPCYYTLKAQATLCS
ncbi:Flavonoid 3'-monooxygenase CYP75B137 [Linum perenne]